MDNKESCVKIVDIIFDKIVELMSKDKRMNMFQKSLIVGSAKNIKEPCKRYIYEMNNNDAQDIVDRIKKVLE